MSTNGATTFVALLCLNCGNAAAATTTGRITYMTLDRQLMLDNSDMYAVGPAADLSSVAIADRVRINWDNKDDEAVITSLIKMPLTPAIAS